MLWVDEQQASDGGSGSMLLACLMISISDSIQLDCKTYTSRLSSFIFLLSIDVHKIIREMQQNSAIIEEHGNVGSVSDTLLWWLE